jgi:hypothetical protein
LKLFLLIEIKFRLEITFLYSWWSYSDLTIYIDPNDLKHLTHEYTLNLVNHRYEIDWLVGLVTAQRLRLLGVSFLFIFFSCFWKDHVPRVQKSSVNVH